MHISAFTHKLYKSEADQCMNLTSRARNALKRLADIKSLFFIVLIVILFAIKSFRIKADKSSASAQKVNN